MTSSLGRGRYMWWFYWIALRMLGEHPIRIVANESRPPVADLDGLIVGGGDDIAFDLYGGVPVPDARIDPARDRLEIELIEKAMNEDIPILGICRGSQMINVVYGGTLHENIYEVYDALKRRWTPLPVKDVSIVPGSRLRSVLDVDALRVNSLHTQSVDRIGAGLDVTATDEHGVVQAIEDPSARFRIGVQWHPEFMIYRSSQRRLFRAFVAAVDETFAASGRGASGQPQGSGSAARR